MKLKKLLAAVTAAALAVTTMAVSSFTASAAAFTPYILLNVNSNTWGINGAWVEADKTEITASQTEYEFSYTAGKDDTWDGNDSKIEAYFYSPMDNLKNASIKSVSINGTDKNISQSAGSYNLYLWDNIESGSVPGYSAVVNSDAVKALGTVTSGDVIKIVLSVTLDESVKSIGAANFTCSKTAGELEIGDSFTITYDSSNTPDTAKWVVKCSFDEDFADAGITSRWPQLVNADGTVDNSASADTGLEVSKTAEGVYTFTAVNASKAGYAINVEASAAGDFSDTQYLGQGGSGKWSVATAAEPTYSITPSTATIKVGESKVFTLEGYDGTDPLIWSIDTDFASMKLDSELTSHQVKIVGVAKSNGPLTLTIKKSESEILATAAVTIVEDDTPPTPAIPEGTKVTLNDNPPYNWQNVNNVTIPGITNWTTTVAEAKEKLDSVTFTFSVNGALSNGTEFDISKLGFQGVIQTNDTEGLWKTYDATVNGSKVTITMTNIGAAFGDKTGAVNFAVAINTAYDNAEDPVDVYISEIKVDVKAPDEGGDDPNPPTPPVTGDKTFEGETTITCDNYWGQTTVTLEQLIGDLDPAKTTVVFTGEFINKIGYNSVSQTPTADGSKWREIEAANGKITLDASDLVTDGFYFVIAAGKESGDATISWVATEKGNKPDEPDQPDQPDPPTPPVTTDAIWEGSTDMGTDWSANVQIPAAKFAEIKAGDTLKYTFTCEPDAQIKIMSMAEGWPAIPGPDPDPEWGTVNISGTSFSFVLTDADVTALKEFGMAVSGKNYTLTKVELVPKSEPNPPVDPGHTHTPATAWTSDATGHWYACAGCDEKLSFAAHTSDGGIITTPATDTTAGTKTYKCTVCGYVIKTETIPATGGSSSGGSLGGSSYGEYTGGTVIPSQNGVSKNTPNISGDSGRSGWQVISAEIIVASDGDKIEVDMNNVTKVPSTIFKDIEGKDVDLVLNMGRGIKWTVNGLSVTSHKNVDFDVTKNTRHIPSETVDKAEGSYKKQISLDHRGSFGCAATLTYDIGAKYNGLYANIFYYNPKTEELELVDCSLISGGKANFMFTHASDYLITVTDEPLGEFEDVSSAAGIASDDNSIGSGIAVSAVLAAVVLGFGIVVYRKRRHN